MSTPSGNFVTDELWLASSGGSYWVEVGYLQEGSGLNVGGITSPGRYGFWADSRPGGGFHAHVLVNNPSLAYTYMDIEKTATNTYTASFGGATGTSASNSMTPSYGSWGSETTSGSSKSYSYNRYAVYLHGSTWSSGVPNAGILANVPEQFWWISRPQSYNAGVTC